MKGKIDILAVISGIVLLFGGIILTSLATLYLWPLTIHGIIAIILGIVILLTLKKQEHIEPIRKK